MHRVAVGSRIRKAQMDVLCFAAAFLLIKLQLDETPVWVYLLSIQFVIVGLYFIAVGEHALMHV